MSKIPSDTQKRISVEFQNRIFEIISDENYTKEQFGKAVGISNEIVSRITIYGIIPSLRTLLKIADKYDMSLPYLLGETNTNDFVKAQTQSDFQSRLNELRANGNLKYSQIAKTMPFSANYFYEWERTKTLPSLDYLYAIANFFKVSPDYLLGRTDYKN